MSHPTYEKIRVRYGETDAMGHAYYGNYLLWFELARGAWCRDRGFTYKSLEERGLMLPCVEAHLRYKSEIKYDDLIVVEIVLAEFKRAAIRFDYKIVVEESGKLCTEGYTWHVAMGRERKAIAFPPDVRELMARAPVGAKSLDAQ